MSAVAARILVFVTSAAVLVLEILAGRLLAPYLGVTIQTFTGIIGTVLAGISVGAWLGGWFADRMPPRRLLGPLVTAGGALAMAAPTLVEFVGPAAESAGPVETVFVAGIGFFAPAAALSAVPPVVVKIRLSSLDDSGTVVGSLSAIGTAGAIFGTFVTGFVLVAAAPSRAATLAVGAALCVYGLALTITGAGTRRERLAAVLVPVLGLGLGAIDASRCEVETAYVCARVVVDPARDSGRIVWSDTYRSSYIDLDDPAHLEFRYARNVIGAIDATQPDGPLRTLYVGGGGFTLPHYLAHVRPGSFNLVLEIDEALVDIVADELAVEVDGPSTTTRIGDARLLIRDVEDGSFDVAIGDAFAGLSVPWHLTTREFLEDVAATLDDGGLYLMNVIDYPPLGFARAELATLRQVFDHVAVIAPRAYLAGERGGNYVLVGSNAPIDPETVRSSVLETDPLANVLVDDEVDRFVGDSIVLTDDYAPVDQLLVGL